MVAVQASDALRAGFADVLPSSFPFERVQPKPDLAVLGRPNAAVVVARLTLKTLGRTADIDLLVARAALDGFAERLAVLPADEPENADPRWSERLEGQVSRAPMALSAVVELDRMTLGALAALKVGPGDGAAARRRPRRAAAVRGAASCSAATSASRAATTRCGSTSPCRRRWRSSDALQRGWVAGGRLGRPRLALPRLSARGAGCRA